MVDILVCDCNGNADSCIYNHTVSGPVCVNCANSSYGQQCQFCEDGYFSTAGDDENTVCEGMPNINFCLFDTNERQCATLNA